MLLDNDNKTKGLHSTIPLIEDDINKGE